MTDLIYKRATISDITILTETRIEVLRAANTLPSDVDMSEIKEHTFHYYKKSLPAQSHIAYLVFDGDVFVGSGGISFFQVMPICKNER